MFKELDVIALTTDIPLDRIFDVPSDSPLLESDHLGEGLKSGDVGAVVCVYNDGEAFEAEFLEPTGRTVAIATILPFQARPATREDIANYRFAPNQPALTR